MVELFFGHPVVYSGHAIVNNRKILKSSNYSFKKVSKQRPVGPVSNSKQDYCRRGVSLEQLLGMHARSRRLIRQLSDTSINRPVGHKSNFRIVSNYPKGVIREP